MQASIYRCLSQARRNWEGWGRKGIQCKNRGWWRWPLISLDGILPSQIVSMSASDIFPRTIKSRRRFLLAPAHPGSPRKRAIKRLCVFVVLYGGDDSWCNVITCVFVSSAIKGYKVDVLRPSDPAVPSRFDKVSNVRHIIFTAETHNFPTGLYHWLCDTACSFCGLH